MSFYDDFITLVRQQVQLNADIATGRTVGEDPYTHERITGANVQRAIDQLQPFAIVAKDMLRSKIIRLRADQTQVFLDTPLQEGQDYLQWLRLPFPSLYIQPEQPVPFHGYVTDEAHSGDLALEIAAAQAAGRQEESARLRAMQAATDPVIRGMIITEIEGDDLKTAQVAHVKAGHAMTTVYVDPAVVRIVQTVFLLPLPGFTMNIHGLSLGVTKDNVLRVETKGHPATRRRIMQWLVHIINFLSSPSVKLVATAPSAALQKARAKHGKPPLPGWYEITYRRHVQEYTKDKIAAGGFKHWEHSFRYDVHGHFKTFTRGRMAGRVLWCPPHQRGLKHDLYKPKGYRQEGLR